MSKSFKGMDRMELLHKLIHYFLNSIELSRMRTPPQETWCLPDVLECNLGAGHLPQHHGCATVAQHGEASDRVHRGTSGLEDGVSLISV